MVSIHTDCPTIERFAWQEPNHLMAPSIMYMKDGPEIMGKVLYGYAYRSTYRGRLFYGSQRK